MDLYEYIVFIRNLITMLVNVFFTLDQAKKCVFMVT